MKMLKTLLAVAGLAVATACTKGSCAAAQYCDKSVSCAAKAASGESCSWMNILDYGDADLMCASGLKCISSKCAAPLADGSSCAASNDCLDDSFCTVAIEESSPVCAAKVAIGGACADTQTYGGSAQTQCKASYCSSMLETAGTAGTCTAYKAAGEACADNKPCAPGILLYCSSSNVCVDGAAQLGAALGAAVGMAGGILAAIIIIPICVCICCCVIIYKVMSKGKGDD